MSEPDYEQIMEDRELERDERWLEREDRRVGRVEDWTSNLPRVDELEPMPPDVPQQPADERTQDDTPAT